MKKIITKHLLESKRFIVKAYLRKGERFRKSESSYGLEW